MKTKVTLITIIIFIVILITGCFSRYIDHLPTYERELNDQDGVAVIIDGVKYKALPELKWHEQRPGEKFGKAGGKTLYLCENDPDRNFIFIWDDEFQPVSELHHVLLYRTDREILTPSAESVDKLLWQENNYRGEEAVHDSQWIKDKEIIEALFDEMKANEGTRVLDVESFNHFSMNIYCYSELVPGARYYLWLGHVNGKLVCGNYFEGFVEFSPEVLEQIAGHDIELEVLITGR